MVEITEFDLFNVSGNTLEVYYKGESYFYTLQSEEDVLFTVDVFINGVVNKDKSFSLEENIFSVGEVKDKFDCDICGFTSAIGWKILFNGEVDSTLTPLAHCYEDKHYTFTDLFVKLLSLHGLEVVWKKD